MRRALESLCERHISACLPVCLLGVFPLGKKEKEEARRKGVGARERKRRKLTLRAGGRVRAEVGEGAANGRVGAIVRTPVPFLSSLARGRIKKSPGRSYLASQDVAGVDERSFVYLYCEDGRPFPYPSLNPYAAGAACRKETAMLAPHPRCAVYYNFQKHLRLSSTKWARRSLELLLATRAGSLINRLKTWKFSLINALFAWNLVRR